MRFRLTAAVGAALALAVGAAACGGSSSTSSTTSHTSVAAATSTLSTSSTTTKTSSSTTTSAHKRTSHKAHKTASHAPKTTTSTTRTTTTTTTHTTTTPHKSHHPKPSGPVGPIQTGFVGENHAPLAGHLWFYTVTARDGRGAPLAGTVATEFVFNGTVVGRETPPTHPLVNGHLHDDVTFPAESVGLPLVVQVVIHTKIGTVTLDWSVKVRR